MSLLNVTIMTARRFIAIDGYGRALALAAKAFVALVPLVLVVAWAPLEARQRASSALINGLGLDGGTAAAVRQLVARPPDAGEPVTIVGFVLLVVSVLGFARSLQRTFETAWELPRSGLRGYGPGLLGSAVLVADVAALILFADVTGPSAGNVALVTVVRAVAGTLAWWPVLRLLVGGGCAGASCSPAPSSREWDRRR